MREPTPIRRQAGGSSRRSWWLAGIAAVIVVILIFGGRIGGLVVDWLWFQSVGYESVFSTRIIAQVIIFAVAAVAFLAIFIINTSIALRIATRPDVAARLLGFLESSPRNSILRYVSIGVGIILALVIGSNTAAGWDVVMRYLNPTAFGVADPLFGQDVGFYVFSLPMFEMLLSWFMATIFLSLIGSLAVYAFKLVLPQLSVQAEPGSGQPPAVNLNLNFGRGVIAHALALVALLILGFAAQSWLDTYGILYSSSGLIFGATYADVNARLPFIWASLGAAVLFAVLLLATIGRNTYRLALAGLGIWIVVGVLGVVYPGVIQRFVVQPSQFDKERPYIEYNISLTNQAYALDRIEEVDYPAEDAVTAQEIQNNFGTINNIRLWDPRPLLDTYNQIQSIRLYYDFVDVDVDRYMVDGQYRQVMLSARELSPEKLATQAQTWVNRRLQFTHGYGAAVSPVNEVTPEGLPHLFLQDVPPTGKLTITRPEIYYGENTHDWVIVKTTTPEFDYPKGNDNVYVTYTGDSGVPIGSFLNRLLFAWQFGDLNLLFTGSITPESHILYNRTITGRATSIAPFLSYDRDPYLVVADGRLYWILDAYTHTDRYPYSQPTNIGMVANYLRNSAKVVVDAYDGSINFYMADTTDPIIQTYARIFPGMFQSLDQMPQELHSHLRYPEDLFSVQADLFRTYHMKDAQVFYNREDLWNIPNRLHSETQTALAPYYVIMRLIGEPAEEFALILPYSPPNKGNMITWLAARCDGDNYGKLVAYKYSKDKLIYGPQQIEARIDQDPTISAQLTLWDQSGSNVIRGDLLVIPIGQSNLYAEPIYLQSEQTKLPEMKRVVLATGNRVVMETSVSTAIAALFGEVPPSTPETPTAPTDPGTPSAGPVDQPLSDAAKALLDRYDQLQTEMDQLRQDLEKLLTSPTSAP